MKRPTKIYDHLKDQNGDPLFGGSVGLIPQQYVGILGALIGVFILFQVGNWRSYEMKDAVKVWTILIGLPCTIVYINNKLEK